MKAFMYSLTELFPTYTHSYVAYVGNYVAYGAKYTHNENSFIGLHLDRNNWTNY